MSSGGEVGLTRARTAAIAGAVVVMTICFIVGTPRSAGPDEPAHAVASAALVRGDRALVFSASEEPFATYRLPGMIGQPDPACFALRADVPASCLDVHLSDEVASVSSNAAAYPIWGHLAAGLASFVPSASGYQYWARALDAVVPVALLIASLLTLRRIGPAPAVAALVGFTPIAWFTLGVINPSGQAIAGGLALWVGLLSRRREWPIGWLALAGWAAMLLTRREGGLWAALIVVLVCIATDVLPSELWRHLSRAGRVVFLLAIALQTLARIGASAGRTDMLLAASTAILLLGEPLVRVLRAERERGWSTRRHLIMLGSLGAAGIAALVVLELALGRGTTVDDVEAVIGGTGAHLRQFVGVMGWVDAPTPESGVLLWWFVVGMLFAVAVVLHVRAAVTAALGLGAVVVTAWVLELGGATAGWVGAWQGRYSVPLTVGLPVVLVLAGREVRASSRVAVLAAIGTAIVLNLAFMNTQRRWGVGFQGTLRPWRWNTWGAPVAPALLVVVHLVASIVLVAACASSGARTRPADTFA